MVVTANPMSGRHVTLAHDNFPRNVQCANPICFCNCLHSFDPQMDPSFMHVMLREFSGMGKVGQDFISLSPG